MLKVLFWIYTLLICFLSFYPVPQTPTSDKLNHFIAFLVFAILLRLTYKTGYWAVFIYSLLFGIFIEIVQYFLPYRSSELQDVVADLFGTLSGMFLYSVFDLSKDILKQK